METRNEKRIELGISIFLLALFTYLLIYSYTSKQFVVSKGLPSMAVPRVIIILILALSVSLLTEVVNWFRNHPSTKEKSEKKLALIPKTVWISMTLICLYAVLWSWLGFTLSTILYLTVQAKFLRPDKPLKTPILVAVFTALVLNVLFVGLFQITFPEPLLELIRGF